jgi:hypothetical protein
MLRSGTGFLMPLPTSNRAQRWLWILPLAWLHMSGCSGGENSGSYTFPTAILGVRIASTEQAQQVRQDLARFAVEHELDIYQTGSNDPLDEPLRAGRSADGRTEYSPDSLNAQQGFSMGLDELSPECFVILFSERSRSWTKYSLASLQSLESRLSSRYRNRVHLLVRPKKEQNWSQRQDPNVAADPEWPKSFDELCTRMNVSQPRAD